MHIASGDLWAGAEAQLYTLAKTLQSKTDALVCVVLLNHGKLEHKLRNVGVQVVVIESSEKLGLRL